MENNSQNHISVVKKSSLNLYELSLESSSNTLSYNLLDDVWCSNNKLFNREAENHIFDSTTNILEKADTNQKNIWKTALSKIDPISLLERSMATCANGCYDQEYVGLEQFKKNECQCIKNTSSRAFNDVTKENKIPNSVIGKNKGALSISEADRSLYDRHSLKHKFGKEIPINVDTPSNLSKNYKDVDWDKEEEAEKAHKSNVAKITFKTAKDQLLASNPAARRVLGTSRKAQGKFVSPMIGTNIDKQELEPGVSDDRLKNIDAKMIELIENEIIDRGTPVAWEDIAGLQLAKSVIQEAVVWPLLRPDIFTGLRRPPKGILLFGPPGTGKTLIGKCVAAQCQATFFNISASSLTSKWIGDGEKMVRALFTVARTRQPAVIFIDEIDSLLTQRSDSEHEASRRLKTEFLVQLDGAATGEDERVLVVGATNRPHELDEAARRRLVKRLYIPLPEHEARAQIIGSLLRGERHSLSAADVAEVSVRAAGYSGADVRALCEEAALGPVRAVPLHKIHTIHTQEVRPLCLQDFINALQRVKPTVSQDDLSQYVKWNETFGQGF